MAFNYAHGSISWLAADAATTTYVVSGLGFQPSALRFSWNGLKSTTDATSAALSIRRGIGFCVSTSSRRAVGSFDADAAATTDCAGGMFNDGVAVVLDGTGAVDGELDVSAIGADGFTAIVDNQVSVDITVFWEAWGGDEITVAVIGDIAEPAATGNVDYTATGFSGTAVAGSQVVMLAGCQSTATVNTGAATDSGLMVGYATGASGENIVLIGNSDDASAQTDSDGYARGDECLGMIVVGGGTAVDARAALTQFGTDNFRLNWAARALTNRRYCFMAIRGGRWRAGDYTIDALTLNATTTVSGLSFTPVGLSLIGYGIAESTSNSAASTDRMGWGCGSSTSSRRAMASLDENSTDPSELDLILEYDLALCFVDGSAALGGGYDINAMNADGFQIIVDSTRASATEWQGYLTFGSLNLTRAPGLGAMTLAGLAPTIVVTLPVVTIEPGLGALSLAGLAPAMDKGIIPPVGAMTLAGLAPTIFVDKALAPGLGALTLAGLAPTMGWSFALPVGTVSITGYSVVIDRALSPNAGAITVAGYAPTLDISYSFAIGSGALVIGGLAPTFNSGQLIGLDIGAAVISGLAPTVNATITLTPTMLAGAASFSGLAPSLQVTVFGGGGYGGLLVVLGLNFEPSNTTPELIEASLQITGWSPSWGAGYTYGPPKGSVTVAGYAPVVTDSSGDQAPVMAAPVALAITGFAPTVIAGRVVTFPFATTAEGFVATPGAGSTMAWAVGEGNPAGSLRTITTGFSRTDDNSWVLSTDWASLGIPADQVITAIALASADSFVFKSDSGSGTIKSVILKPTGFSSIQIAPVRSFSVAESGWSTQSGNGTSGVQLPSGGSLTITVGSTVNTTAVGTPDVRIYQDNVTFVVQYEAAKLLNPLVGSVSATGYAPTVVGTAALFAAPAQAALAIQGSGPSVVIGTPADTGGGGPGLLIALALNLEQRALGPATLTITGYAPAIFRPIVLSGSDDLLSLNATMSAAGTLIVSSPSTTETPGAATLVAAGQAPTVIATEQRLFTIPVTALTFTRYVPTPGIDHVRDIAAGTLVFGGFGPATADNPAISPALAALTFTGYAPIALVSATLEPDVGAITITGNAPAIAFDVTFSPASAALAFLGYEPSPEGHKVWNGSGDFASQRATAIGSGLIIRHASGVLQSQQPLAFNGAGAHGHTAVGVLQSGPASFHGPISATSAQLQSQRATMLGRGKHKPFHRGNKHPKPPRINRFNVALKPNKRHKFKRRRIRRPF